VPSATLAREHLKTLTAVPHWASSPEDYTTAVYVAEHFKAAGLETEIVPYSVLLPRPASLLVEAFDASGAKIFSGPGAESPRPDPRVLPPFNSGSPSGDVTAQVVYANYGRREDYARLAQMGVSVKAKIVLVRYGQIFRGTKVYLAQQAGAVGVLIFTDPADTSPAGASAYPDGPNPPAAAVQRGSVQFLPIYPGDPTTPGVASTPALPEAERIRENKLQYDLPSIPSQPLSAADAVPILRALGGAIAPQSWQGAALGSPYHVGSAEAPVTIHMRLAFDVRLRTIWDVIGRIPGMAERDQLVIAGNHRDAWVYGAADPSSGTAAMLEAVHGIGALLRNGWRPRRTVILASWDGEEEGLIGSTEWVEQHMEEIRHAVAYFNCDVAASGPVFVSAAVPSLHRFVREIANEVPSGSGRGSVLDAWTAQQSGNVPAVGAARRNSAGAVFTQGPTAAAANAPGDQAQWSDSLPRFGDLGSGSDYSPFLDHAGVPSTDIGADGPFGVYHSAYDNFDWYTRFVDPDFALIVQQARIFGLEILHMADADVVPEDELAYAGAIRGYIDQAKTRARAHGMSLDFAATISAADSFVGAARVVQDRQRVPAKDATGLSSAIVAAEHAFAAPEGLPLRPWYRHVIYAPGLDTGYAPEVLPGVNDAIDAADSARAQAQLGKLAAVLQVAASTLEAASR
jgi:N-acetylated-alpha-linked acidic dipeptidase